MVIKQINFEESSGKLIVTEDNDTQYYCDIYGEKIRSFLPEITGQRNSPVRRNELTGGKIERNLGGSIYNHSSSGLYLPIINKFEGYSKFPQPLSPPFYNLDHKLYMSSENKRKLIKTLKKHFTNRKVVNQFSLSSRNEDNNHLTYMMTPLKVCVDYHEGDKNSLIKLIDEHLLEYKKKNQIKLGMKKDPFVKALKRFRLLLEESKNVNVEKKLNLNRPSGKVLDKYKNIKNKLNKNLQKKNNKTDKKSEKILEIFDKNFLTEKNQNDYDRHETNHSKLNENSFISILSKSSIEDKKLEDDYLVCFNLKKLSKNNLKSKEFLRNSLEIEKKYIEGFKDTPVEERGIFRKITNTKFKSEGDFYPETIKLLKKCIDYK